MTAPGTLRRLAALAALAGAVALAACGRRPLAIDPAAPAARELASLFWWFTGICLVVYLLVMAALAIAIARSHRRRTQTAPSRHGDRLEVLWPEPRVERRLAGWVGAAATVSLVVLVALLVVSVRAEEHMSATSGDAAPVSIRVTGRQWWWSVEYPGERASDLVTTANEIHVPVGAPSTLELTSADVIHSFWVPRLHGKKDLIPGRKTSITLQPDRAGVFDGQCAEFCGHQHAHMGLRVVAEPRERFEAWLAEQRRSAPEPATGVERRGRRVFLDSSCVLCHTVRGTDAGGRTGPDLTHLASRTSLAASTLDNSVGHLAGWVLDPQTPKPGSAMPPNAIGGEDLQALLAWLGSLE